VLVTHKASLLRLVDRVIVMDQGRILMDGARSEILAKLTTPVPPPQTTESANGVSTAYGNKPMQASS
jgi:ATP-binding cassette subfamily C protein LapB